MVGARKSSNFRGPLCFCRRTKPQPNCQNLRSSGEDQVGGIQWSMLKTISSPFLSSSKCKKWHQTTILLCQLNKHKPNNLLAKNMSPANVQVASGCFRMKVTAGNGFIQVPCQTWSSLHKRNECLRFAIQIDRKSDIFPEANLNQRSPPKTNS